jgi:Flp pilus assembly protein TadG
LDNKLHRDEEASALVQFTLVFPLLMLVVLGTVDCGMMFFSYAGAYKATYAGARFAAVSDPVAPNITSATTGNKAGLSCFDPATGAADATASCNSWTVVCTPGSGNSGNCTGSAGAFQNPAFTAILDKMQSYYLYRTLDRRQVVISYQSTGLGYVSRPGGSPMTVTVSLRCMKHELFFLGPLMNWAFPALPAECSGIPTNAGMPMPTFATTLPSEDLTTQPLP